MLDFQRMSAEWHMTWATVSSPASPTSIGHLHTYSSRTFELPHVSTAVWVLMCMSCTPSQALALVLDICRVCGSPGIQGRTEPLEAGLQLLTQETWL
jgi:hypothetical protein